MVLDHARAEMIEALAAVAPGRPLRDGLDRVLQAGMGGLIVVGDGPEVLELCSGGFLLDADFSPQRLHELAKMDGAIILAADASRIARANVHLVPDPHLATAETGTRHRTAERVARAVDVPVIAVSEDMAVITVYRGGFKRALDPVTRLIQRANQALQTLERYRDRLDTVTSSLSALEVEDLVTVRDVVLVLQRAEMVRRIAEEVEGYIVELGTDGRLIRLQVEELMGGVDDDRRHVIRDYVIDDDPGATEGALRAIAELSTERLLDLGAVADLLRLPAGTDVEASLNPRGYRLLSRIPRLAETTVDTIVGRHGSLQKLLRATAAEIEVLDGVDAVTARAVKDGLARLAESSILDSYN
jgi:diadenylate cyclase